MTCILDRKENQIDNVLLSTYFPKPNMTNRRLCCDYVKPNI
uniref:Uncharacterized protein n=1 Tax=Arundo donax TaxID=35708 RepID=A0A0A9CEJ4_ARUDO